MHDDTEQIRRAKLAEINAQPVDRAILEARFGKVWSPDELAQEFVVEGFIAPYVVVLRKADDIRGSLAFQHHPRFYFDFVPVPFQMGRSRPSERLTQ